ncbi:MAG: TetR family transcriptional regulator [Marmoricola sp.]|nr:TetR family transcriptional regulator [Marmoricola sp.]
MGPVKTVKSDELALRLVDEAGRILSAEGPAALTLRRLAQTVGISTMPVYTLFGDKRGLLSAMYRDGYRRLGDALRTAGEGVDDPLLALLDIGHAYRATALANAHLYDLMFGRPDPAFEPGPEAQEVADAAYRPLVDGVRRCVDAGLMTGGEAERIAFHLWSVSHGMVSLELAGLQRSHPAQAYDEAMVFSATPFLV